MSDQKFSERVRRALDVIGRGELTRQGLRNFYDNATRDKNLTEAEREAVISALEARIRITSPRDAKAMFGPKDADARAFLARIHDALEVEFDLSGNTVGAGVKTGGDMISGKFHVVVYISYKGADRRHTGLAVVQRTSESDPILAVSLYQTGRDVSVPDMREEFPIDAVTEAVDRYRMNLMQILGVSKTVPG